MPKVETLTTAQVASILARCGYTDPEQVKKDATEASQQALAEHVISTMSKNKVLQPKMKGHSGGMFAEPKDPLVPTVDLDDYESIQKQYEQY